MDFQGISIDFNEFQWISRLFFRRGSFKDSGNIRSDMWNYGGQFSE